VGRPASEIGGRGRLVSPANMRISRSSAAFCSSDVAVGPMQRNHSAVEVMRIDISGPPDVGRRRSQIPRIFFAPALRRGFSLAWRKPNPARGSCKTGRSGRDNCTYPPFHQSLELLQAEVDWLRASRAGTGGCARDRALRRRRRITLRRRELSTGGLFEFPTLLRSFLVALVGDNAKILTPRARCGLGFPRPRCRGRFALGVRLRLWAR
jgi:hypothetical protein